MLLFSLAMTLAMAATDTGGGAVADAVSKISVPRDAIVTPADRAMINAKCGYAAGDTAGNISFKNGALVCRDGKEVSDDETRALSDRISQRAKAYSAKVMNDPEVRAAIDGTAQREAAAALRRAADGLEKRQR